MLHTYLYRISIGSYSIPTTPAVSSASPFPPTVASASPFPPVVVSVRYFLRNRGNTCCNSSCGISIVQNWLSVMMIVVLAAVLYSRVVLVIVRW